MNLFMLFQIKKLGICKITALPSLLMEFLVSIFYAMQLFYWWVRNLFQFLPSGYECKNLFFTFNTKLHLMLVIPILSKIFI